MMFSGWVSFGDDLTSRWLAIISSRRFERHRHRATPILLSMAWNEAEPYGVLPYLLRKKTPFLGSLSEISTINETMLNRAKAGAISTSA
jgi:hypothetical protein